ncbi:hypothetical protein HYDPIDRAFT_110124 [Hydnomerulius pinastri MD-312]|nr:hypothetical protein HYDPIDRAFT_110124 [Hydnomerulius pinastri MD-312]
MTQLTEDDEYYMTLVILQVEDCLFRVPRRTIESQSKVFRDMFSLPTPVPNGEMEGSSNSNPIHLHGIKKDDIKCLLKVLFTSPPLWRTVEPPPIFKEWFPIIKLSKMWEFNEVHKIAINKVPYKSVDKSAVEKVALAFQHDIKLWLLPGLNELAQRREPLCIADAKLLGLEVTLKVAAVRESMVATVNTKVDSVSWGHRNATGVDFTPSIQKVFQLSA